MRQDKFDAVRFFERHIEKSVGCTEPAAVALASSIAFNAIRGRLPSWLRERGVSVDGEKKGGEGRAKRESGAVESVLVRLDRGTFKNALNAVIPHTGGLSGVSLAAALGIFCEPDDGLALFNSLSGEKGRERLRNALALLKSGRVRVVPDYERDEIFILARVRTSEGEGECLTRRLHSEIVSVRANGNVLFDVGGECETKVKAEAAADAVAGMRVEDFISIVEHLPESAKERLRAALETNRKAFEEARRSGRSSFAFFAAEENGKKMEDGSKIMKEWLNKSCLMVGTAVECRMLGLPMEVMTCAGSGNMGLTVSLPFVALKDISDLDEKAEERMLKAFALAHIVANFAASHAGFISATCGCATKAGVGLSAALAYFLAGFEDFISRGENVNVLVKRAINNMVSDITGLICEGASRKCALKASTAVISAFKSAFLALKGVEYVGGIVENDANATLRNLGEIARAMREMDKKIVKVLERAQNELEYSEAQS